MDTFSSSVSTLKISSLPPPTTTKREFHHFTRTRTPHHATPNHPPQPKKSHFSSTSIPNLASPKTKTFSHNNRSPSPSLPFSNSSNTPPFKLKPSSSSSSSSPIFHHKATTGYAAAIIDIAQNTNSLHSVQLDVQKLLKFLQKLKFQSDSSVIVDPSTVGKLNEQAVKKVVEQGKFQRHVVALVKMLTKKNKLGIVEEVLEEFERIYDELCGTQVVLVSSEREIEEDEMFGIAKSVWKISGNVRVRVRNLVQENSFPSFYL